VFDLVKSNPIAEIRNGFIGWFKIGDIEYGYLLYNKIISFFSYGNQTITVTNSFLIIVTMAFLVILQSSDWWLSVFLYFSLGFYQLDMNLTPSAIARLACLCALPLAWKQKWKAYFIIIALASAFHNSVAFFALVYFFPKIKLASMKDAYRAILSCVLALAAYPVVTEALSIVLPNKYQGYIFSQNESGLNMLVYIFHAILFLFLLFSINDKIAFASSHQTVIWMMLIESVLYLLSLRNRNFTRGAFLVSVYIIIAVPNMLDFISKEKESLARVCKICIVVICAIQYVARLQINNIGSTVPYLFFWE
jgi:hypothetical protein